MSKHGSQKKLPAQTKQPKAFKLKDFKGADFTPHDFETRISLSEISYKIFIPQDIMTDMLCVAGLVEKEVSWLGIVDRTKAGFMISEIFVPEQSVSFGETEMTEQGIHKIAETIMARDNGVEQINKLRLWCHTHPSGGTSPSGPDKAQSAKFMKDVDDFFIRGIANKKGKIEFTVYLIDENVIVYDAPWAVYDNTLLESKSQWLKVINENVTEQNSTHFPRGFGNNIKKLGNEWCFKTQKWVDPEDKMVWCTHRRGYVMQKFLNNTNIKSVSNDTMLKANQKIIDLMAEENEPDFDNMTEEEIWAKYWDGTEHYGDNILF